MPKSAIFDVDGTLIDSVDLHALAWHEAFVHFGYNVTFEQARSQIGKGGDNLLPEFLTPQQVDECGPALEDWRGKRFKNAYLPLVRPFSAVPALLQRLRANGIKLAAASSAKKDELDVVAHRESRAGQLRAEGKRLSHAQTSFCFQSSFPADDGMSTFCVQRSRPARRTGKRSNTNVLKRRKGTIEPGYSRGQSFSWM